MTAYLTARVNHFVLFIAVTLALADAGTTWYAIGHLGYTEANPGAAAVLTAAGLPTMLIAGVLLFTLVAGFTTKGLPNIVRVAAGVLLVGKLFVVISNCHQIWA
jgi:hypothetical protein